MHIKNEEFMLTTLFKGWLLLEHVIMIC